MPLVPDATGPGTWVLSATVQTAAGRSSGEALAVVVAAVRGIYG